MAIQYDAKEKLCELIYKRPQEYYPQLYDQLDKCPEFIETAIGIIYELDKKAVKQSTIVNDPTRE